MTERRAAALEYVPLLRPGDRFSHTSAAELWHAPLPRAAEGKLHVSADAHHERPRGRGVIGHRTHAGHAVTRQGVPVSDAVTAFLESAPLLSIPDLVAVGDHLVLDPRQLDPLDPRPFTSIEALRAAAARFRGRGALKARAAASQLRAGAESRRETLLRLLLLDAGLPHPECGHELRDGRGSIGWFDLAWPQWRAIAEYDGDQHRTSTGQYVKDISRYDRAIDLGWRPVRVRARGLYSDRADTVRRVLSALRAGGWRGEP